MIEARRLRKEIQIPKGVEVTLGEKLTVKKGKYVISKKLSYPTIELKKEEEKFNKTLEKGLKELDRLIQNRKEVTGEDLNWVEDDIGNFSEKESKLIAKICPFTRVISKTLIFAQCLYIRYMIT